MKIPEKISGFRSFNLTRRFFITALIIVAVSTLAFAYPFLAFFVNFLLLLLGLAVLIEILLLYGTKRHLTAERKTGRLLSLGDENSIDISVLNQTGFRLRTTLYDEIPVQFQFRNFGIGLDLPPGEEKNVQYKLRPVVRGEYHFGYLNAHTSVLTGFVSRRFQLAQPAMIPVMPSVIQMKKYELLAFAKIATIDGIKKVRRLGHSYEFEKIRMYAQGDDLRSINWKATGRRHSLMVNQYEDERSQQVYMVIDKSRNMHMPFNGLSLLDYSINTSLVLANIALKKYDKTGLISYSNAIGSALRAERSELQLKKIMNHLYYERPQPFEADYDLLYRSVKNIIKGRSLILLFLNFESMYAMERALPFLQKINRLHLLVVMIFENTELHQYSSEKAMYVSDIYAQTITKKLIHEKKQIVAKLRKYGIQTILSKPEDLSINTVNKYLELKAKGLI